MSRIDNEYIRQTSCRRIIWVIYVKLCTCFIPDILLIYLSNGRLTTKVRQQAWREKITVCLTYLSISGILCFWLEYITYLFCDPSPTYFYKTVYSNQSHYTSINGQVVDWTSMGNHSLMTQQVNLYPHKDISPMFPLFMQLNNTRTSPTLDACINGANKVSEAQKWLNHKLSTDPGYLFEDGKLISCPLPYQRNKTGAACFYTPQDLQEFQKYHKKGSLEYTEAKIFNNYSSLPFDNSDQKALVILDNKVLDVTNYLLSATNVVQVAKGTYSRSFALDRMFLPLDLTILLFVNMGRDITEPFRKIEHADLYRPCLSELFLHGVVDKDDTDGCLHINLALWITMGCSWIYLFVKLNLSNMFRLFKKDGRSLPLPVSHYLLMLIPCLGESAELVRKTVDALAWSSYPDSRKLLFFVCDGLVQHPNDPKPTYLSLLDSLGYSSSEEPELRTYVSLGQGRKRLNHAKVFSGFYESGSHRVPFVMVVKMGSPDPDDKDWGNRGKRDSILICLGFLERCTQLTHHRMSPLEFEIFNQTYHLLGIDPRAIKYMLVTDADTQVQEESVTKLVSRLESYPRVSAVSGHVRPANPEENLWTMIQIIPLYLALYSSLAYEACLGKVTVLNGGLVMYRIWSQPDYLEIPSSIDKFTSDVPVVSFHSDDSSDHSFAFELKKRNSVQPSTLRRLAANVQLCCAHPTILRGLAGPHPTTMHMENLLLQGEEQYLSLVLLRARHQLAFEPEAIGYIELPSEFSPMMATAIRHLRATFHHQLESLTTMNHLGFGYWLISWSKLLDMVLTTPVTLYLYSIYIRYFVFKTLAFAIIAGSFTCLLLLQIGYFILRRQFMYIAWFLLYCFVAVPIYNILMPVLAVWYFDHADRWYDVYAPEGSRSRLHGILTDRPEEEPEEVVRMRLSDFEVIEAERALIRQREQAEMLDAKFSGFTSYRARASSSASSSVVSIPPHLADNPFHGSILDDPFEEGDQRKFETFRSSLVHPSDDYTASIYSTQENDQHSILSLSPPSVMGFEEQETDPHRIIRGIPHRPVHHPFYETLSEGRSAPVHSKFMVNHP